MSFDKNVQSQHLIVLCMLVLMINLLYSHSSSFSPRTEKHLTEFYIHINETTAATIQTQYLSATLPVVNLTTNNNNNYSKTITHVSAAAATTATKYFINTSQCRVPYVDPFTADTFSIFNPNEYKYKNCANDEAFISPNYLINTQRYFLHMNMPAIERALKSSNFTITDFRCCYRQIIRFESDDSKISLLPCSVFHQDFSLPPQIDYIITECYVDGKNHTKKILQKDAFSFIQKRQSPVTITNSSNSHGTALHMGARKPSILFLGIDALSRINMRRTMPKTFRYLEENRWFELQGYNKVGDNTFPNLMALLTSYNLTRASAICKPKSKGGLNKPECNLIWNNFKDYGYKTAYAEDAWQMSTFNYLKKGFQQSPTDYYLRPLTIAITKNLKTTSMGGLIECAGRKHYAEYIFDYALQFANVLSGEPYFGLFWTNSFSHNVFNTPTSMDVKVLEYLKKLEKEGILENSIVIFFSDHGMRWGPLLKLKSGFIEERLPMMFISLPLWFENEYPHFAKMLEINQHRLTSPYDIYATMKHILQLVDPAKKFVYANGTIQGMSLFHEIPYNRTCAEAGITEHWCTCSPYEILSNSDATAKKITKFTINEINKYLSSNNVSKKCNELSLKVLSKVEMKMHDTTNHSTYRITFMVKQKNATFQATIIYNRSTKVATTNVEEISRFDSYEKVARCIDLKVAKKFCICLHT